jgi:hypothetical protein
MSSSPDPITVAEATMEDAIRAAGMTVTEEGKRRWRERLSQPMPEEVLDAGRQMRAKARGEAA